MEYDTLIETDEKLPKFAGQLGVTVPDLRRILNRDWRGARRLVGVFWMPDARAYTLVFTFTGDCLFPGGPGRTTRPEDFNSLMGGLEEKVFGRLPDATWIYPGHGNDTTLGAERPHLKEWRERGW